MPAAPTGIPHGSDYAPRASAPMPDYAAHTRRSLAAIWAVRHAIDADRAARGGR